VISFPGPVWEYMLGGSATCQHKLVAEPSNTHSQGRDWERDPQ